MLNQRWESRTRGTTLNVAGQVAMFTVARRNQTRDIRSLRVVSVRFEVGMGWMRDTPDAQRGERGVLFQDAIGNF